MFYALGGGQLEKIETMNQLVTLIMTNGIGVVLIAYFIFKDWKFNQSIIAVLNKMNDVLIRLESWHNKDG